MTLPRLALASALLFAVPAMGHAQAADPHAGHTMTAGAAPKPGHTMGGGMALKASTPANGSVVTGSPKTISLTLDHAMVVTAVTLTNARGQRMPMAAPLPKVPVTTLTLPVRPLAPGSYTVAWTAGGADHTMKGSFGFTVR